MLPDPSSKGIHSLQANSLLLQVCVAAAWRAGSLSNENLDVMSIMLEFYSAQEPESYPYLSSLAGVSRVLPPQ